MDKLEFMVLVFQKVKKKKKNRIYGLNWRRGERCVVQKQHQNLETPYQVLKLTGISMIRNPIGTMHINKLGEEMTSIYYVT